ncbi:hypothetical protein [Streptomyces sp. NPDC088847]|uniref:hypothetical protein n=1 Tax=Streptomyces sp. NPDC088847 TaxID=3365909 RepID=UPI003815C4A9
MSDVIHIEPAPEQRTAFARWGVRQTPKIRTVGVSTFAVDARLFVEAPEEILIGSLVDGHPYVSPHDEDQDGGAPPSGVDLVGVATEEGFTAAAGGDSTGPDFAPLDDAPAPQEEDVPGDEEGLTTLYGCPLCPRDFDTERGRDTHRRQAHRED